MPITFATRSIDSPYLKSNIGSLISECLSDLVVQRPIDPIEFIAQWLYHFATCRMYFEEKQKLSMAMKDLAENNDKAFIESRERIQALEKAIKEYKMLLLGKRERSKLRVPISEEFQLLKITSPDSSTFVGDDESTIKSDRARLSSVTTDPFSLSSHLPKQASITHTGEKPTVHRLIPRASMDTKSVAGSDRSDRTSRSFKNKKITKFMRWKRAYTTISKVLAREEERRISRKFKKPPLASDSDSSSSSDSYHELKTIAEVVAKIKSLPPSRVQSLRDQTEWQEPDVQEKQKRKKRKEEPVEPEKEPTQEPKELTERSSVAEKPSTDAFAIRPYEPHRVSVINFKERAVQDQPQFIKMTHTKGEPRGKRGKAEADETDTMPEVAAHSYVSVETFTHLRRDEVDLPATSLVRLSSRLGDFDVPEYASVLDLTDKMAYTEEYESSSAGDFSEHEPEEKGESLGSKSRKHIGKKVSKRHAPSSERIPSVWDNVGYGGGYGSPPSLDLPKSTSKIKSLDLMFANSDVGSRRSNSPRAICTSEIVESSSDSNDEAVEATGLTVKHLLGYQGGSSLGIPKSLHKKKSFDSTSAISDAGSKRSHSSRMLHKRGMHAGVRATESNERDSESDEDQHSKSKKHIKHRSSSRHQDVHGQHDDHLVDQRTHRVRSRQEHADPRSKDERRNTLSREDLLKRYHDQQKTEAIREGDLSVLSDTDYTESSYGEMLDIEQPSDEESMPSIQSASLKRPRKKKTRRVKRKKKQNIDPDDDDSDEDNDEYYYDEDDNDDYVDYDDGNLSDSYPITEPGTTADTRSVKSKQLAIGHPRQKPARERVSKMEVEADSVEQTGFEDEPKAKTHGLPDASDEEDISTISVEARDSTRPSWKKDESREPKRSSRTRDEARKSRTSGRSRETRGASIVKAVKKRPRRKQQEFEKEVSDEEDTSTSSDESRLPGRPSKEKAVEKGPTRKRQESEKDTSDEEDISKASDESGESRKSSMPKVAVVAPVSTKTGKREERAKKREYGTEAARRKETTEYGTEAARRKETTEYGTEAARRKETTGEEAEASQLYSGNWTPKSDRSEAEMIKSLHLDSGSKSTDKQSVKKAKSRGRVPEIPVEPGTWGMVNKRLICYHPRLGQLGEVRIERMEPSTEDWTTMNYSCHLLHDQEIYNSCDNEIPINFSKLTVGWPLSHQSSQSSVSRNVGKPASPNPSVGRKRKKHYN